METIEVYPGTGKLIKEILSELEKEPMNIVETPADLVSYLIGYYQGSRKRRS